MRGDPDQITRAASEQSRAARDKHREPDGWEADARADNAEESRIRDLRDGLAEGRPVEAIHFDAPEPEVAAFRAGLAIGRRDERNRIKAALDAIQREAAPLMIEGSSFARAMAKVIGETRRCVEGGAL